MYHILWLFSVSADYEQSFPSVRGVKFLVRNHVRAVNINQVSGTKTNYS